MTHVDLPRPLADYFAFAEIDRRGEARRFTLTLPYLAGEQLGRLQWWWRVSLAEENLIGDGGLLARRLREVERFRQHVERWLTNTGQRLHGDGPIPRIAALPVAETAGKTDEPAPIDERRYA